MVLWWPPNAHAHVILSNMSAAKHAASAMDDLDAALAEAELVVGEGQDRTITHKSQLHDGPGRSELPQELQDASKGDTVCDVCGVSFLVYSEMKVRGGRFWRYAAAFHC